eukprot:1145179-Pelagomonas_calceolata.AAC.3
MPVSRRQPVLMIKCCAPSRSGTALAGSTAKVGQLDQVLSICKIRRCACRQHDQSRSARKDGPTSNLCQQCTRPCKHPFTGQTQHTCMHAPHVSTSMHSTTNTAKNAEHAQHATAPPGTPDG